MRVMMKLRGLVKFITKCIYIYRYTSILYIVVPDCRTHDPLAWALFMMDPCHLAERRKAGGKAPAFVDRHMYKREKRETFARQSTGFSQSTSVSDRIRQVS